VQHPTLAYRKTKWLSGSGNCSNVSPDALRSFRNEMDLVYAVRWDNERTTACWLRRPSAASQTPVVMQKKMRWTVIFMLAWIAGCQPSAPEQEAGAPLRPQSNAVARRATAADLWWLAVSRGQIHEGMTVADAERATGRAWPSNHVFHTNWMSIDTFCTVTIYNGVIQKIQTGFNGIEVAPGP